MAIKKKTETPAAPATPAAEAKTPAKKAKVVKKTVAKKEAVPEPSLAPVVEAAPAVEEGTEENTLLEMSSVYFATLRALLNRSTRPRLTTVSLRRSGSVRSSNLRRLLRRRESLETVLLAVL